MSMAPAIVCVDFNGVLDSYSGWRGASHFDPPRPGAREFLEALIARGYRIVVFTTRYPDDVWKWLDEFGLRALVQEVTDRKPAAHVFVDDRAVCFRGDFQRTLDQIDSFTAHWENTADGLPPDDNISADSTRAHRRGGQHDDRPRTGREP